MVKSDWHEFVTTLGFPAHNAVYHPCPTCCVPLVDRSDWGALNACGHALKTMTHFLQACRRCEQWRDLNQAAYLSVRAKLWYDKRDGGAKGRALRDDVPEATLMKKRPTGAFRVSQRCCIFRDHRRVPSAGAFLGDRLKRAWCGIDARYLMQNWI